MLIKADSLWRKVEETKHHFWFLFFLLAPLFPGLASSAFGDESYLQIGRFGRVAIYQTAARPSQVVLFVSGDGGWNLGVADMARALAGLNALVVGVDINVYLRNLEKSTEECVYPAADFEALGKFVQKYFNFPDYKTPVLVGYSSGATLVYAVLAQAPASTFQGAISLGFCPDLSLHKQLCYGNGLSCKPGKKGGIVLEPAGGLARPWIALQGTDDQVCDARATTAFVSRVENGSIVLLPGVGHGFSVQRNWLPQFKKIFRDLGSRPSTDPVAQRGVLSDLPLVEVAADHDLGDGMAVFLSGDGGWSSLDQEVSSALTDEGMPVVGLNMLKYLWKQKEPDGAALDLARIMSHYGERWQKQKFVLIGYSLGADVLPFLVSRLPSDLLTRVSLIVLLGPGSRADFEFHLSDWLGASRKRGFETLPEVTRLTGMNLLCLYGKTEKDSICPMLHQKGSISQALEGGHHFGGAYRVIAGTIMKAWQATDH